MYHKETRNATTLDSTTLPDTRRHGTRRYDITGHKMTAAVIFCKSSSSTIALYEREPDALKWWFAVWVFNGQKDIKKNIEISQLIKIDKRLVDSFSAFYDWWCFWI